jgi:hypothetical protein
VLLGVYFDDLVEVPPPVTEGPHRQDPAFPDLSRKNRLEPVPSRQHRIMHDVDAAFVEQTLHIPQRQRVANMQHHHETDDLGHGLEVAKNAGATHPVRLAAFL